MGRRNRKRRDEDPARFDKSSETFRWFNTVLHQAPALVIVGGDGRLELPVGYYTGNGFKRATRRPAGNAIHWDRW